MGDIYSIIYGAVGGGVTGVIAAILGGIAIAYFKRLMAERDKLAEQEPLARRAAELVGKRAGQYETRFGESSKLDVQDLVSMAAWDIAYDFLKLQSTHDADLMARELERIDTELESYMQHAGTSPEDD